MNVSARPRSRRPIYVLELISVRVCAVFLVLLLLWSGYLTWVVFVEPSIVSPRPGPT